MLWAALENLQHNKKNSAHLQQRGRDSSQLECDISIFVFDELDAGLGILHSIEIVFITILILLLYSLILPEEYERWKAKKIVYCSDFLADKPPRQFGHMGIIFFPFYKVPYQ